MVNRNRAREISQEEKEAQLRELLGDDYEVFLEVKERKQTLLQRQQIRALTKAMCEEEDGKYYPEYHRLDQEMQAIWDKAMAEAEEHLKGGNTNEEGTNSEVEREEQPIEA